MKGIKKTFMAGILACSTLHAQADEISPFSYGIKGGMSTSFIRANAEAKFDKKEMTAPFFGNPYFFVTLYGGYAFTDYIGVDVGIGYMNQGGTLEAAKDSSEGGKSNTSSDNSSIAVSSHGIEVPLSLCIYPLGREENLVKLFGGPSLYIPIGSPTLTSKEKEIDNKDKCLGIDLAIQGGAAYEFTPVGFLIELRYGYGLLKRFTAEKNGKVNDLFSGSNLKGLTELKGSYATLGIGYNIASLFCCE